MFSKKENKIQEKEELEPEEINATNLEDEAQNLAKEQENITDDKKWSNVFKSKMPETSKNDTIVEKLMTENKLLKDNLLITSADLENARRRHSDELEKSAKFAISKFAEDLIPVMDAFYLAMDNIKKENVDENKEFKIFFDGINLTFNELKKIFDKNKIIRINPLGEQFDHNYHQAISQVESEEEEGTVIYVMQAGYSLNGRLVKPALVSVAK